MDIFLTALGAPALLLAMLWLARHAILKRLGASIQHEFDAKLASINSQLRSQEDSLRAELRAKEQQITTLQTAAMSGLASRQAGIDRRRLEAVDQIWKGVVDISVLKWASTAMTAIDLEAAIKKIETNPDTRLFFATIAKPIDFSKIEKNDAGLARPYLSDLAWAYYLAYVSMLSLSAIQLQMLGSGLANETMANSEAVEKLVLAALPHQKPYIEQYRSRGFYYLLDELELKLLTELRKTLSGNDLNVEGVAQAAAIVREAERVMSQVASSPAKNQ